MVENIKISSATSCQKVITCILYLRQNDMIRDNASVFHNPYLHGLPLGPAATERIIARAGGHEAADYDDDAGDDAYADHGERDCLIERPNQWVLKIDIPVEVDNLPWPHGCPRS